MPLCDPGRSSGLVVGNIVCCVDSRLYHCLSLSTLFFLSVCVSCISASFLSLVLFALSLTRSLVHAHTHMHTHTHAHTHAYVYTHVLRLCLSQIHTYYPFQCMKICNAMQAIYFLFTFKTQSNPSQSGTQIWTLRLCWFCKPSFCGLHQNSRNSSLSCFPLRI